MASEKASRIDTPELRRLTYAALDPILAEHDTDTLIELLDSSSGKVGGSAADLLARRGETKRLIELIETDRLRTWKGRWRALFVLGLFGLRCPEALRAYRHALHDKSKGVLDEALFKVVLMRDVASLPVIESLLRRNKPSSEKHDSLLLAKKALETGNPYIYMPSFEDSDDRWNLGTRPQT